MRTIEHHPEQQQFSYHQDGLRCVLDYRLEGQPPSQVMAITHTGVPSALEGQGIAADLARTALETARRQSWKVRPVCSYIVAYLRRHPEYSDLQA